MNIIFFIMMTSAIVALIITNPNAVLSSMIDGASNAFKLAITMLAIYCVWMSVLTVMEKSGLNKKLTRLLSPLTRRMFKGESEKTLEYITMNLSANLLGMGGCATPMGIKAIETMAKNGQRATPNMQLFTVINCTSIQLFPATIIGLRIAYGSISASDIIIPSLIATTASTIIGVILIKVLARR